MPRQNHGPPAEPLVVILGSTGTGKSDLAVEIACRFQGEIINADAMQMYHGLPVTTNKISEAEKRGVPHHLLGTIGLNEEPWKVGRFKQEATRVIREIRSRGRLPIVVGGTHYYTDGLLFENHLVDDAVVDNDDETEHTAPADRHPILHAPVQDMLAKLQEVDPVMAARWHPKDERKIRRSLEIYLTTGQRASDIYARQKQEKADRERAAREAGLDAPDSPWQCLLLWVYAQRDVLNARLDARIETMLDRGLLEETAEMHGVLEACQARGETVDRTQGIWQSIGLKEMEPYLAALKEARDAEGNAEKDSERDAERDARLDQLRTASLDSMKFATRRYARYQLRWIKHKTIPLLAEEHALDHLFLLDSTDKGKWQENVAQIGVRLTAAFLGRADQPSGGGIGSSIGSGSDSDSDSDPVPDTIPTLPAPEDVSDVAREVLTATIAASQEEKAEKNRDFSRMCDVCNTKLMSEVQWNEHIRGQRHRRVVQKKKRRALVPVFTASSEPNPNPNPKIEIASS